MTTIDQAQCRECGKEGTATYENGVITDFNCDACGAAFSCELENQGEDQEAWDAYPDGWICEECGERFAGIMPVVHRDFIVCEKCERTIIRKKKLSCV